MGERTAPAVETAAGFVTDLGDGPVERRMIAARLGIQRSPFCSQALSAFIDFLGYDPLPQPTTLGGRIRHYQQVHRISRWEFARRLGADETRCGGGRLGWAIPARTSVTNSELFLTLRHRTNRD